MSLLNDIQYSPIDDNQWVTAFLGRPFGEKNFTTASRKITTVQQMVLMDTASSTNVPCRKWRMLVSIVFLLMGINGLF